MSALSIDYGTARASRVPAPGIEQERLAEVIQLPARWQPNAEPVARPVRLTARGKLMVKVVVTILAVMVSIGGRSTRSSKSAETSPSMSLRTPSHAATRRSSRVLKSS